MSNLILGLDPGSLRTGFGVISAMGGLLRHVDHGVIELNGKWSLARRLKALNEGLNGIFARYDVKQTVVEKIFFGKNADSAFKLGHARGVCLLACAHHGSVVHEYAARFVKKSVTGSGAASKDQIQLVIGQVLGLRTGFSLDASDALALAVTHVREGEKREIYDRLSARAPT